MIQFLLNEEKTKCTIEEFAVYFLNFVRNQTEEYNKNCSSSCNTPRKVIGHTAERASNTKQSTSFANNNSTAQLKLLGSNNSDIVSSKTISRDLFSSTCDSPNDSTKSIKLKAPLKSADQIVSPPPNDGLLYSDFTGNLKTTLTPIPVHRLNSSVAHAFSTPSKNISSSTSTPSSFKQHCFSNRSGNSQSRNSTYNSRLSSNDSRSFDDNSSTGFDTSVSMRSSHDKSKDKRSANASGICLGDFLTPMSSKHSQKARKSFNSTERSSPTNASNDKDFPSFTPKGKPNRIALTSLPSSSVSATTTSSPLLLSTSQPHGTLTTTPKSNQTVKPTRRVVPTRIGSTNNEFNCPAFRSDNNILELAHEENAESTRDLLKSQKDMLRRVFQEEQVPETNLRAALHESLGEKSNAMKNTPLIDLKQITNKPMLDKFIDIYSIVLDLNLVTNILTEVAYLVNLINLDVDEYYERNPHMLDGNSINDRTNVIEPTLSKINAVTEPTKQYNIDMEEQQTNQDEQQPPSNYNTVALNKISTCASAVDNIHAAILLLKNINNCIYFGLGVLQLQKNILRMLDVTSIKVLLENERRTTLDLTIKDDLMTVYTHKMQLERLLRAQDTFNSSTVAGSGGALLASNTSMKVFYQQEQDTQMYFPSPRESAAFKKQRDHFYSILGTWESKHLNPAWDFETELGRKVRSMLNEMDHPINMAHMAKLFTAQLILSCNFNNEVIQSDLPNIDPGKLNKLRQRLVAPSHFSTNFQFPGNQAFFKDFIIAAEHQTTFIEQLKINLTSELIEMNDSSYETLNLSTIDENDDDNQHEYIVKPETLSTLSVLAKFLGLIVARPFIYEFGVNTIVDNRQIELRNKIRTMIDIKEILKKCVINHKLIVTLPWVVQFIAMLDPVSLRSDYYRDVFGIFYELYAMTAEFENNSMLSMRRTSVFIIRSCLGWLFDQPNVPNEYYTYRQNRQQLKAIMQVQPTLRASEFTAVEILVPKDLSSFFSGNQKIIMPRRNSKTVSRTGRYRHITPKICESPSASSKAPQTSQQHNDAEDAQAKLVEAFLHSQSLSVRRTVEFVQERVYSAVVKDFQVEVLIPFKKSIVESIDKIQLKDSNAILNELYRIYSNGEKELLEKWQDFVTPAALQRVKIAFDALLPHETVDAGKLTCINIAVQQALARINEWRSKNLKGIEIFSKDIQGDVEKVLKNTLSNQPQMENTFLIDLSKRPPWQTFDIMQCRLHELSMYPERIHSSDDVNNICTEIRKCISEHVLPDPMYKTIGIMTVHLVLLLICNRHDVVTKQVIDQFISLWQCKQFAMFVRPPTSVASGPTTTTTTAASTNQAELQNRDFESNFAEDQSKKPKLIDTNYMFSLILSPLNIFTQQNKSTASFDKLAQLMTKLIKNRLMSISFVNEQSLKLLHMEWEQATLKAISTTIQSVIDNCRNTISSYNNDDDNDALLLETLADLISGLDDIAF